MTIDSLEVLFLKFSIHFAYRSCYEAKLEKSSIKSQRYCEILDTASEYLRHQFIPFSCILRNPEKKECK